MIICYALRVHSLENDVNKHEYKEDRQSVCSESIQTLEVKCVHIISCMGIRIEGVTGTREQ